MIAARLAAVAFGFLTAVAFAADTPLARQDALADFDAVWKAIDRDYAYMEGPHSAWKRARETWRPRAAKAASRDELAAALDGLLSTLHDDAVFVVDRWTGAPRRVPVDADIWARWRDGAAVIEAVRIFGDADVAGLKPGDTIVAVDGTRVERAVADRLQGTDAGPASRDWALRRILTGPRSGELRVRIASEQRRIGVVERRATTPATASAVLARRVGDARDAGYLRVKAALDDARLAPEFDAALDQLAGTRGLILDLREVTGNGGARATTQAILGRFVTAESAWQLREGHDRTRTPDRVAPRGTPYTAPLIVLVDRWTAGEGEALAAGLSAVAKARLVGTSMAGLRGEPRELKAPRTGLTVRFPAQRALLPDGTARERLVPSIVVDLSQPQAGAGDPILYQGLRLLE